MIPYRTEFLNLESHTKWPGIILCVHTFHSKTILQYCVKTDPFVFVIGFRCAPHPAILDALVNHSAGKLSNCTLRVPPVRPFSPFPFSTLITPVCASNSFLSTLDSCIRVGTCPNHACPSPPPALPRHQSFTLAARRVHILARR